MKIQTKDCVKRINEILEGTWKRSAKYRGSFFVDVFNSQDKVYTREFICKEYPNKIAFVSATNENITNIKILDIKHNAEETLEVIDHGHYQSHKLRDHVSLNAPLVLCDNGYSGKQWEELDTENFEVAEIRDTEIDVNMGGDWQTGMFVTLRYMSDGNLYWKPGTASED